MKFAQLALLGLVAAQQTEDFDLEDMEVEDMEDLDEDVEEMIGERWAWKNVGPIMKQEFRIMGTLASMENDFKKMGRKLARGAHWAGRRYGPELKAWGESGIVKIK